MTGGHQSDRGHQGWTGVTGQREEKKEKEKEEKKEEKIFLHMDGRAHGSTRGPCGSQNCNMIFEAPPVP